MPFIDWSGLLLDYLWVGKIAFKLFDVESWVIKKLHSIAKRFLIFLKYLLRKKASNGWYPIKISLVRLNVILSCYWGEIWPIWFFQRYWFIWFYLFLTWYRTLAINIRFKKARFKKINSSFLQVVSQVSLVFMNFMLRSLENKHCESM